MSVRTEYEESNEHSTESKHQEAKREELVKRAQEVDPVPKPLQRDSAFVAVELDDPRRPIPP